MPSLSDLLRMGKQYIGDALPGGSLNPEMQPIADRAQYIAGGIGENSPMNRDLQSWHGKTQRGLSDLIAGNEGPQADYGYAQMMNMVGVAPIGMTAWHGSPHKFDKFSLDKIGTGEGAQSYGHGLYLAESPEVAKSYKSETAFKYGQRDMADMLYSQKMGNVDKAIASLKPEIAQYEAKGWPTPEYKQQYLDAIKKLEGYKVQPPDVGQLYKTDIPDEAVARMLDWEKPLSEQSPEVLQSARKALDARYGSGFFDQIGGNDVRDLLNNFDELPTGGMEKLLQQNGITGIRYLDSGSRGAKQGTSNFVAFDPEMIRILERNGQPTGQVPWKPNEWRPMSDLMNPRID